MNNFKNFVFIFIVITQTNNSVLRLLPQTLTQQKDQISGTPITNTQNILLDKFKNFKQFLSEKETENYKKYQFMKKHSPQTQSSTYGQFQQFTIDQDNYQKLTIPKNENISLQNINDQYFQQREDQFTQGDTKYLDQLKFILQDFSAIRLGIFEARRQRSPEFYQKWETKELGSTRNAINTYRTLLQQNKYLSPLTFEIISEIRRNFNNQQGNYQLEKNQEVDSVSDFQISFRLPYLENTQINSIHRHQTQLREKLQTLLQSKINIQPYEILHDAQEISSSEKASANIKKQWIIALLQWYENSINIQPSITDERFLEILSELIIDLERIHPYLDFNCRTFAVFILNKELLRRGMSPSIVEDPNEFDYLDIEGAVEIIKEGQRNFQNLYQYGRIHNTAGKSIYVELINNRYVKKDIIAQADPIDELLIENISLLSHINYFFCRFYDNKKVNEVKQTFNKNDLENIINQTKDIIDLDQFKQTIYKILIKHSVYSTLFDQLRQQTTKSIKYKKLLEEHIHNYFNCPESIIKVNDLDQIKKRFSEFKEKVYNDKIQYKCLV